MDYEKLSALFISDPDNAIKESKKIICSITNFESYQDFYSYHQKNAHISTCPNEWSSTQLCIYCRDCAAINPSCICLPCFLDGNHKGHNYVILKCSGNCDCGDLSQWKSSGCCPKHHGLSDDCNPEDYIDEKLRTTLVDIIFKAAFSSLKEYTNINSENASNIIQFISTFLDFGDGFRRLIAQSLTEKIDLEDLITHVAQYSTLFNESLQQLCGGLVNDKLFIRNFAKIGYKAISNEIIKDTSHFLESGSDNISYASWDGFLFHIFGEKSVNYSINHDNWDWISFYRECLPYYKDMFDFVKSDKFTHISDLLTILSIYLPNATKLQPNEPTQQLLDIISTEILSCGSKKSISKGIKENNTIIVTSFDEMTQRSDYFPIFQFISFFYLTFYAFRKKPNLKFDTLIDELDKTFDISSIFMIGKNFVEQKSDNENDKFIFSLLKSEKSDTDTYYNSFHNGGSFFLSHPLFHSLVSLFRNDNITRIKIAKILSKEKYQNLRIRIGIATLKTIISNICHQQSLVPHENVGLSLLYDIFNSPDSSTNFFTKFYPLFQLIIGLKGENCKPENEFSLKEFFAFESAREIGLFDNLLGEKYHDENIEEKRKQMIFSFLYVSLLIVIERTLFNYNGNDFIQEQLIFELKKGVHSIDKLNKLFDKDAIDSWSHLWVFNYLLNKVSTTNQKEKDEKIEKETYNKEVSFYLKENIEWNSISAINSLNEQMTLMNDEISKNSDKLIKIQNFVDEEEFFFHPRKMCKEEIVDPDDYDNDENENLIENLAPKIQLTDFLSTPTVIAIIYYTLRTNNNRIDLNDHLAMNILVLISKFILKKNENSMKININEIQYDSLSDLISKLKKQIFNYKVNELGNSIIDNILDKKNFISLLKLKFNSSENQSKSFIEILLEKGKIGRIVLNEISSNLHHNFINDNDNQNEKEEENIKEKNKQKAKKLKEEIMNHYKNVISSYNLSEQKGNEAIEEVTTNNNNNEICSICSTHKNNKILTYPLYIYRTKFPFIFDKPPKFDKEVKGKAVDDNYEDFDLSETKKYENEEEEEEEESVDDIDAAVSPDAVMSIIMNEFPQLTETEGLSDEDVEERQNTLSVLFDTLMNQQLQRSNQMNQQKKFLNKAKQMKKDEIDQFNEVNKKKNFKRCTAGANFILQFGICQHPVHFNCVQSRKFTCPIDRSIKNGFLPLLEGIKISSILDVNSYLPKMDQNEDSFTYNIINTILAFISNCASFFKCINLEFLDIFIELIKSLSGLISTYEIRLRNRPDCLDSKKTKLLSRNLFLTVWYGYRIQKKPKFVMYNNGIENEDCETRMTTFQKFIKRLIECDKIETEFSQIVSFLIQNENLNEIDLCLFLRRVCLAEYFLLNSEVHSDDSPSNGTNFIDWDEVLSPSNLSVRYKVNFRSIDDGFEFKPFSFLNLPKEFLSFGAKPFNFHIEKVENLSFFNMIDYNYLIENYNEVTGQISSENEEVEIKKNSMNLNTCDEEMVSYFFKSVYSKRNYPSLLLFVGKYASQIFLIDQNYFAVLDTFYLDKYGCADIGYKRSQPLFLNEERYEKCIDTILSGDFSYSLIDLSQLDQ